MVVGPPTVTQTSETRPAKTTTTAAGPRWTSASVELAAMEGGGGGGGCLWVQVRRGQCTRAEQPRSDGGKGVGEDGSERAEVSTNVVTVAAAGDNRHQRTWHHAAFNFCGYASPGYKNSGVRRSTYKDSCRPTSAKIKRSICSYSSAKFGVGRRARSPPPRGMKAFASDGKFGTPAKKRSRRIISSINRGVTGRMCLITTDTYLRTLSIAVAPNSRKLIVTNWRLHQFLPRVPVGGIWNAYSVIGSLSHTGKLELV